MEVNKILQLLTSCVLLNPYLWVVVIVNLLILVVCNGRLLKLFTNGKYNSP